MTRVTSAQEPIRSADRAESSKLPKRPKSATSSRSAAQKPKQAPAKPSNRTRRPGSTESFRARARRVVRDVLPPDNLAPAVQDSGLSLQTEKAVLDLALRVGESMVSTGASVASVTAAMLRLAHSYGVHSLYVDATFVSLTVTVEGPEVPMTRVRVVTLRAADYSRLAALAELVDDAVSGTLLLPDALERLDEILRRRHPYRRAVVTIALGAMAAGVAILLGGGLRAAAVAFGTTVIIDRTLRVVSRRGLPSLFQQALGAGIATSVALLLLWAQSEFGWNQVGLPASVVVASGIVVLLAGLSTVGAAEDAIAGFPLTAAARTFEVILNTVGIVIGVGIVLDVGNRIGVPLTLVVDEAQAAPWYLQMIAGAIISGGWAVASYALFRTVIVAFVVGAVAAGGLVFTGYSGFGPVTSSFLAALFVGFGAYAVSDRLRVLPVVITICGITPLLPGLAIYRAMFTTVDSNNFIEGATLMLSAVGIGLALAAGVTLGQYLAVPFGRKLDRWQLRIQSRARGNRHD